MIDVEQQLRDEMRTAAERINPDSVRPLRAPLPRRRSRMVRWLAPAAAAAAVVGLIAGLTVAGHTAPRAPSAPTVHGAVATVPDVTGTGANCIFPMEPAQCYRVANYEDFEYLMVRPLYMFGNNGSSVAVNYALSPAKAPRYSNGGKTITITLKGWKWSDGRTVDAKDLIFFLNMLEAEKANYAGYTPGLLPDNISSYFAISPYQVVIKLRSAYSSVWYTYNQLAILYPFPLTWDVTHAGAKAGSGGCTYDSAVDGWAKCKAVWNYLNKQNMDTSTYATNPLWRVVDGPWKLTSYHIDGNYSFVPNKKYSGSPKPSISELKVTKYSSDAAIYKALRNGKLSEAPVPTLDLLPASKNFLPPQNPLADAPGGGYNLQAALSFAIGYAYINYNNPTYGPVFQQLYFRQALAMLDNQHGMVQSVGRGYGAPTVAGVPDEPTSPWVSPVMQENGGYGPYPYNVAKAEALLAAHGWKKVDGVLTCERAGAGASDCGTGIPKGRQAKFTMLYPEGVYTQEDDADIVKSALALAGIQLTPKGETLDTLLGDSVPCHGPTCTWTFLYLSGWSYNGPGFEPTGETLFQTGVENNSGSYTNAEMNNLVYLTHTSNSLSTFYDYADYTAVQEPSLWLPWPTSVEAVSKHMQDVSQSPLSVFYPEYWRCTSKSC